MNSNNRIWLSPPHMSGHEMNFVEEAFASNWIAPLGPHVEAFEQELATYLGTGYCTAVNSGTAALHLAMILLDVQQDDYVICPSFTFSASANPIVYQKATPVFVDSESETWNMDPQLLEDAIRSCIAKNKKPKAIIIVHLYGMPAKMDELMRISRQYEIPVVEDAAESLGSTYHQQHTGTFGDLAVLSFNGNKIITTSGGGALVSSKPEWIAEAKFLATQARDHAPHYQHSKIGYNYRLSNICAAIGRGQMMVLDERVKQRRQNFDFYRSVFSGIEGFTFLNEPDGHFSNRWLTTCIIEEQVAGISPEQVRLLLEAENIESRPLWKPLHLQPVFERYPSHLNGLSANFFSKGICLPSGTALTTHDLTRISSLILSAIGKNRNL